jgi:hypothetical protein
VVVLTLTRVMSTASVAVRHTRTAGSDGLIQPSAYWRSLLATRFDIV